MDFHGSCQKNIVLRGPITSNGNESRLKGGDKWPSWTLNKISRTIVLPSVSASFPRLAFYLPRVSIENSIGRFVRPNLRDDRASSTFTSFLCLLLTLRLHPFPRPLLFRPRNHQKTSITNYDLHWISRASMPFLFYNHPNSLNSTPLGTTTNSTSSRVKKSTDILPKNLQHRYPRVPRTVMYFSLFHFNWSPLCPSPDPSRAERLDRGGSFNLWNTSPAISVPLKQKFFKIQGAISAKQRVLL